MISSAVTNRTYRDRGNIKLPKYFLKLHESAYRGAILPVISGNVERSVFHRECDVLTAEPMRFDHAHKRLYTPTREVDRSFGFSIFIECFGDVSDAHDGACRTGGLWERHFFKEAPVFFPELDFSTIVLYTDLTGGAADLIFGSSARGVIAVDSVGIPDVTTGDTRVSIETIAIPI